MKQFRWYTLMQRGSDPTAASGGGKGGERVAAVEKIEDQRKPDDFFGHRNRTAGLVIDEVQHLCGGAAANGLPVQPET